MNPATEPSEHPVDPWLARGGRFAIGNRCACNTDQPTVMRQYLTLGRKLVSLQQLAGPCMLRRTLRLLLQTAADEALPRRWRSACLEHGALPLARLLALPRRREPHAAAAPQSAAQSVRDRLDHVPAARRRYLCGLRDPDGDADPAPGTGR